MVLPGTLGSCWANTCFTVSASCALALPAMLGCRIAALKAAANQAAMSDHGSVSCLSPSVSAGDIGRSR